MLFEYWTIDSCLCPPYIHDVFQNAVKPSPCSSSPFVSPALPSPSRLDNAVAKESEEVTTSRWILNLCTDPGNIDSNAEEAVCNDDNETLRIPEVTATREDYAQPEHKHAP
jgi:hypothetical protein